MPEEFVPEELETVGICVQEVSQLRSGRRDQEASKATTLTPHFIVSVARGPDVVKLHSLTEICSPRVSVETYITPKGQLQCKPCQRFGHTQRYFGYAPRCVACGGTHLLGECSTFALSGHFPPSVSSLVGWLVGWFPVSLLVRTTYEDGTECSETPAHKIQKPRNHQIKNTVFEYLGSEDSTLLAWNVRVQFFFFFFFSQTKITYKVVKTSLC